MERLLLITLTKFLVRMNAGVGILTLSFAQYSLLYTHTLRCLCDPLLVLILSLFFSSELGVVPVSTLRSVSITLLLDALPIQ